MQFSRFTPWGHADIVTPLGSCGIRQVHTPGHGGIFVPSELLPMIPVKDREYARRWSGSEQWFEEDCAAALVYDAFPHLIPEGREQAIKQWITTVRANYVK